MTPSAYTAIRNRLDHPRVVVWKPVAMTLATDDPEWPVPRSFGVDQGLSRFVRARLGTIGVFPALSDEDLNDATTRARLDLISSWLTGENRHAFEQESRRAMDFQSPLHESDVAAIELRQLMQVPTTGWNRIALADLAFGVVQAEHVDPADEASDPWNVLWYVAMHLYGDDNPELKTLAERFLHRCWARCRALLPIADVRSAAIEWCDIELPPCSPSVGLAGGI